MKKDTAKASLNYKPQVVDQHPWMNSMKHCLCLGMLCHIYSLLVKLSFVRLAKDLLSYLTTFFMQ